MNTKLNYYVLSIGCVIYTLAYFKHPFVEASKLAIVNASINFPKIGQVSLKMQDLIRHMLTPNPKFRPDMTEILNIASNYDDIKNISLNVIIFLKIINNIIKK